MLLTIHAMGEDMPSIRISEEVVLQGNGKLRFGPNVILKTDRCGRSANNASRKAEIRLRPTLIKLYSISYKRKRKASSGVSSTTNEIIMLETTM